MLTLISVMGLRMGHGVRAEPEVGARARGPRSPMRDGGATLVCQESWGWGLVEGAIFEVLNTRRRDTCSYLAWVSTFSTFHRQRHRAAAGPPWDVFFV